MRRTFTLFALLLTFLATSLISTPTLPVAKADRQTCSECQAKVNARWEQCIAVHGIEYQRCGDDFNEGIVHCFEHFCEIESGPESGR